MKIAIIGGTGDMGFGLGLHLAQGGHEIIIGSRIQERAAEAAARARTRVPGGAFRGVDNASAAEEGELVILAVPPAGHRAALEELQVKLRDRGVLDVTIPMAFKPLRYEPPTAGSNALETAEILGEGAKIAAGFHTVSATLLVDADGALEGDTLIVGNDTALKETVMGLAREMGLNAYDAGSLAFSPTVERLTPMLIGMNKRYHSRHIGVRLTGL